MWNTTVLCPGHPACHQYEVGNRNPSEWHHWVSSNPYKIWYCHPSWSPTQQVKTMHWLMVSSMASSACFRSDNGNLLSGCWTGFASPVWISGLMRSVLPSSSAPKENRSENSHNRHAVSFSKNESFSVQWQHNSSRWGGKCLWWCHPRNTNLFSWF